MQKAETGEKLDRSRIPKILFEKHPEYVELYDKAWELAADQSEKRNFAGQGLRSVFQPDAAAFQRTQSYAQSSGTIRIRQRSML